MIERSEIADNTANGNGAGLYTGGGRLTITGSTISGNVAHAEGGGVYSGGDLSAHRPAQPRPDQRHRHLGQHRVGVRRRPVQRR